MKYVIGNNLVTEMATYLLPGVKQINCGTDFDEWNIGTFYIPYYCLDFVSKVFPGAQLTKYELRTMYDMRNTLSAVKPKNFDQIYKLYTRGKVNVENEYLNFIHNCENPKINSNKISDKEKILTINTKEGIIKYKLDVMFVLGRL